MFESRYANLLARNAGRGDKPRKLVPAVAVAAALVASILTDPNPSNAADNMVVFDLARSHDFGGIGVQVWSLPQTPQALVTLLRDLAITQVRMGSFPDPQASALTPGTATSSEVQAIHDTVTASQMQRWRWLAQQLKGLGISVHLVIWQEPKPWRAMKPWIDSQGRHQVSYFADITYTERYAAYICAQLRFTLSLGFPITLVELTNEPDGSWNTQWTPDDYAHLVIETRRRMNEEGLSQIGIEGPGTGTERTAGPYLAALKTSGAFADLNAISVHDYDTRFTPDPVGLTPRFQAEAKAVSARLPIHVTEFNDQAEPWRGSSAGEGGTKQLAHDSRAFGIALAREAMKTVEDGATESLIWEAEDMGWESDHFGLIDEHGHAWPSADALKAFLPAINHASGVVPGVSSNAGLQAAAFLTQGKIAIVLMNADTASKTVVLTLSHANPSIGPVLYTTCYYVSVNTASSDCPRPTSAGPDKIKAVLPSEMISTMILDRGR